MTRKQYSMIDRIAQRFKLFVDLLDHGPLAKLDNPRDILNQDSLGFQGGSDTQKILEQVIARIIQRSNWGVDRESLARWPARKQIKFPGLQPKQFFQDALAHLAHITDNNLSIRMILFVCAGVLIHELICQYSLESRHLQATRQTASPSK